MWTVREISSVQTATTPIVVPIMLLANDKRVRQARLPVVIRIEVVETGKGHLT